MLSTLTTWDSGTVGDVGGTYTMDCAGRPADNRIAKVNKRVTLGGHGPVQFDVGFVAKPEADQPKPASGIEEYYQQRRDLGIPWQADTSSNRRGTIRASGVSMDIQDDEQWWWFAVCFLSTDEFGLIERWQWGAGDVRLPNLDGNLYVECGQQALCGQRYEYRNVHPREARTTHRTCRVTTPRSQAAAVC